MMRSDGSIKLIDFDTVRCYKEKESQDTILLGTKESLVWAVQVSRPVSNLNLPNR